MCKLPLPQLMEFLESDAKERGGEFLDQRHKTPPGERA